jgi:hypothetical protein
MGGRRETVLIWLCRLWPADEPNDGNTDQKENKRNLVKPKLESKKLQGQHIRHEPDAQGDPLFLFHSFPFTSAEIGISLRQLGHNTSGIM